MESRARRSVGGLRRTPHDGAAFWIEVSAARNGTFAVTNRRNGFRKEYRISR
jgi:hypothetical protein